LAVAAHAQTLTSLFSEGWGRISTRYSMELAGKAEGDAQTVGVAEEQSDAATEECYDAWRAMNEHECVATCKPG
jgi:hypothetical protein